jgi:Rho guanine nucleotide exchange factor 17
LVTLDVSGVPHGHTGHVRFLTSVQVEKSASGGAEHSTSQKASGGGGSGVGCRTLVISGGDGYEDFRSSSLSEIAGREDSTNHLLLWRV